MRDSHAGDINKLTSLLLAFLVVVTLALLAAVAITQRSGPVVTPTPPPTVPPQVLILHQCLNDCAVRLEAGTTSHRDCVTLCVDEYERAEVEE